MAKKLYVGNLPYTVTEDELREVFARNGEVQSVRIITDAATGRSKGFGFVEMTSDEDADKAIATLGGTAYALFWIVIVAARLYFTYGAQHVFLNDSPSRARALKGGQVNSLFSSQLLGSS